MKKVLSFSFVVALFMGSLSLFAANQTVQSVLKSSKNYDSVILEGTFVSQVDDDEFIFSDGTGKIKVDISKKRTNIEPYINSLYQLNGAKVKIKALVDKERFERMELKAVRIKVIEFDKKNGGMQGEDDF